jgi:hypothetical protein
MKSYNKSDNKLLTAYIQNDHYKNYTVQKFIRNDNNNGKIKSDKIKVTLNFLSSLIWCSYKMFLDKTSQPRNVPNTKRPTTWGLIYKTSRPHNVQAINLPRPQNVPTPKHPSSHFFFWKPALWRIFWPLLLHRDGKINKFLTCFPNNSSILNELLKFFIENYSLHM